MGRYDPLERFLRDRSGDQLALTFAEVESVIGHELPRSAREWSVPWWSNEPKTHSQARAWFNAGWRVWNVDQTAQSVLFHRLRSDHFEKNNGSIEANINSRRVIFSPAGLKLLFDYTKAASGDSSAALARAVHEAALARRARIIRDWAEKAPRMPPDEPDSVALIREDRDAR